MPVGTHATVKALHPDEVRAAGVDILLCNAYHLALRPGIDLIEQAGGLHTFMGWDHPILTDSGGYQLVSLAEVAAVDDDGATFVSPYDGSRLRVTPEDAVSNQARLGADVLMCLDHPVAHGTAPSGCARGDRAHPPLGRALPGGAPGRWPSALRHRPGRVRRTCSAGVGALHLGARLRRRRDRRPGGGGARGDHARDDRGKRRRARRRPRPLFHGARDQLRAPRRHRARGGHVRLRGADPAGAQRQRADARRTPLAAQRRRPRRVRPDRPGVPLRGMRADSRARTCATSSSRARSWPTGW